MPLMLLSASHKKAGFTLIELIITIIIMSFAAVIIIPFLTAVTHSPDPVLREKAIGLGQAMMDEILAKRWDENSPNGGGPIVTPVETPTGSRETVITTPNATAPGALGSEAGETRAIFDDVDDYNTLSEPDGGSFFYDQTGTFLPGNWTSFTRSVAVDYIASHEGNIDTSTSISGVATDTKRIIVTVTSPLSETFQFVGVSCNF